MLCTKYGLFAKTKNQRYQQPKAPSSVGGRNSMRVGQGRRKGLTLLAINITARTVVGGGEKILLSDRGPELRVGREKENVRRQHM